MDSSLISLPAFSLLLICDNNYSILYSLIQSFQLVDQSRQLEELKSVIRACAHTHPHTHTHTHTHAHTQSATVITRVTGISNSSFCNTIHIVNLELIFQTHTGTRVWVRVCVCVWVIGGEQGQTCSLPGWKRLMRHLITMSCLLFTCSKPICVCVCMCVCVCTDAAVWWG